MNPDTLPLTEAIDSLRGELLYAIEQSADKDLRFSVEAVEVELQVVRTAGGEASASGGLWQVLTVGGKATYSSAATHKIKLVLRPLAPDDDPARKFIVGDTEIIRPE
ncbi:trypco2 family protein [Actinoplanes subglobosus]|uniref:Trypco2 family protein n=1 Tax=Actinoplanes subglobosus TaxID=1547892 RepID=A0ABV8J748_9ACTN